MTDKHTQKARSWNMSKIKSKNTGQELLVTKYLHTAGFGFDCMIENCRENRTSFSAISHGSLSTVAFGKVMQVADISAYQKQGPNGGIIRSKVIFEMIFWPRLHCKKPAGGLSSYGAAN